MKQQLYKTAQIKAGLSGLIPTDFVDGQYVSVRWVVKAYDGFTQTEQHIYSVCADTSHEKSKTSFLYESALENFCL